MTETELRAELRDIFKKMPAEQLDYLRKNQHKLELAMFQANMKRNIEEMNLRLSFPGQTHFSE